MLIRQKLYKLYITQFWKLICITAVWSTAQLTQFPKIKLIQHRKFYHSTDLNMTESYKLHNLDDSYTSVPYCYILVMHIHWRVLFEVFEAFCSHHPIKEILKKKQKNTPVLCTDRKHSDVKIKISQNARHTEDCNMAKYFLPNSLRSLTLKQ